MNCLFVLNLFILFSSHYCCYLCCSVLFTGLFFPSSLLHLKAFDFNRYINDVIYRCQGDFIGLFSDYYNLVLKHDVGFAKDSLFHMIFLTWTDIMTSCGIA